jgi:hypothetical protein
MAGVVVVNQPPVTLYDSSGNEIAPAKEATLATRASEATLATRATEATLASRSSEATLEAARVLLVSLDGKDFATQTTLATRASEATLEAARVLLVSLDAKDFATETTQVALGVILSAIDADTSNLDVLLSTRATEATLALAKGVLDTIYTRQNDRNQKTQLTNGTLDVTVTNDAAINRLEIAGKVSVTGAIAPPATTQVLIHADTPLTVGSHDTIYVIPDGEVFHIQEIHQGNEDPTKGASVEIIYYNGTEHLLERVYSAGSTVTIGYPDINAARDGTSMVGNAGGTNTIVTRRLKYSGSNIAIETEVVGYVA